MQVFYVNVGGGEPMLRPDFFELVEHAISARVGSEVLDQRDSDHRREGATAGVDGLPRRPGERRRRPGRDQRPGSGSRLVRRRRDGDAAASSRRLRGIQAERGRDASQRGRARRSLGSRLALRRPAPPRPPAAGRPRCTNLARAAPERPAARRASPFPPGPSRGADRRLLLPPRGARGAARRAQHVRGRPGRLPRRSRRRRLRLPVRDAPGVPCRQRPGPRRLRGVSGEARSCSPSFASPPTGGACNACGVFESCHGGCMAAKFFTGLPIDGPDPECVLGHGEMALARVGAGGAPSPGDRAIPSPAASRSPFPRGGGDVTGRPGHSWVVGRPGTASCSAPTRPTSQGGGRFPTATSPTTGHAPSGGAGVIVVEEASVDDSDWPYERAPLAAEAAEGWSRISLACQRRGRARYRRARPRRRAGLERLSPACPARAFAGCRRGDARGPKGDGARRDRGAASPPSPELPRPRSQAGCDGVELNAGQYSLLRQFCSGLTNLRQRRARREPGRARRPGDPGSHGTPSTRSHPDAVVGLRLSCDELAPWAGHRPGVRGFHRDRRRCRSDSTTSASCAGPRTGPRPPDRTVMSSRASTGRRRRRCEPRCPAELALVAQGSIVEVALAEELVAGGEADLVEMTRAQIADPALGRKLAGGAAARIRPCVLCNQTCRVRDVRNPFVTCIGEPRSGHETTDPFVDDLRSARASGTARSERRRARRRRRPGGARVRPGRRGAQATTSRCWSESNASAGWCESQRVLRDENDSKRSWTGSSPSASGPASAS